MKALNHHIGVEIELERCGDIPWHSTTRYGAIQYTQKSDGSLRNNGREFVSDPGPIEDIIPSIQEVTSTAAQHGAKASIRTGFHVHTGVRGITLETARRIFAFGMITDAIGKSLWPNRMHNSYCKESTLFEHYAFLSRLNHALWVDRRRVSLSSRYSPINISAIARHGTLEFRRGAMWGDWNRIENSHMQEAPIDPYRAMVYAAAVHTARVMGSSPAWRKAADELYRSVRTGETVTCAIKQEMLDALIGKVYKTVRDIPQAVPLIVKANTDIMQTMAHTKKLEKVRDEMWQFDANGCIQSNVMAHD